MGIEHKEKLYKKFDEIVSELEKIENERATRLYRQIKQLSQNAEMDIERGEILEWKKSIFRTTEEQELLEHEINKLFNNILTILEDSFVEIEPQNEKLNRALVKLHKKLLLYGRSGNKLKIIDMLKKQINEITEMLVPELSCDEYKQYKKVVINYIRTILAIKQSMMD